MERKVHLYSMAVAKWANTSCAMVLKKALNFSVPLT